MWIPFNEGWGIAGTNATGKVAYGTEAVNIKQ